MMPSTMTPDQTTQMTQETPANTSTPTTAGSPNGTPIEQLMFFENIVTRSLEHEDQLAEAINQIKTRKLYKVVHLTFQDYVTARWNLSRSRAYQLLKYARLKEQAQAAGKTPPANERAARKLDADGNPLPPADSYKIHLDKFKRQIKDTLSRLPPDERRKFAVEIQVFFNDLTKNMNIQKLDLNLRRVSCQNQTAATALMKEGAPMQTTTTTSSSSDQEPKSSPTVPNTPANQPNTNPYSYGGVSMMTMEEAKARGLVKS